MCQSSKQLCFTFLFQVSGALSKFFFSPNNLCWLRFIWSKIIWPNDTDRHKKIGDLSNIAIVKNRTMCLPNVCRPNVCWPIVCQPNVCQPNVCWSNVCLPNVCRPNVCWSNVYLPNVYWLNVC